MAQLTGNAINGSYQGLLKTSNNGAVGATVQAVTDGLGNAINLEIGTNNINFPAGNVDFTGATVTGLPADTDTTYDLASAQDGVNVDITLTGSDATVDTVQLTAGTNITLTEAAGSITIDAAGGGGAAGLITGGTGAGSMKNDAALVTTAPVTLGINDLALGNNTTLTSSTTNVYYTGGNVAIGEDINLNKIVDYSFLPKSAPSVGIGSDIQAIMGSAKSVVAIGYKVDTGIASADAVAIGSSLTTYGDVIAIGRGNVTIGQAVAMGSAMGTMSSGYGNIGIGGAVYARGGGFGRGSVAIGNYAKADGGDSVAYGPNANANTAGSIAIGSYAQVPASTSSAIVIGKDSSIQTASQDCILIGNNTALGADGANGSVIIGSNTSRTADTSNSVQIGLLANLGASDAVAIGRQASATGGGGCAVGRNSTASGDNSFATPFSTAGQADSAAFNGVASTSASTTAVANLEVIGNGNGIKLSSPNGTVYTVTVTDGGVLTVA